MTRKQFINFGAGFGALGLVGCSSDKGSGNDTTSTESTGQTDSSTTTPNSSSSESTGPAVTSTGESSTGPADGSTSSGGSSSEGSSSGGSSSDGSTSVGSTSESSSGESSSSSEGEVSSGSSSGGDELCTDDASTSFNLHNHVLTIPLADIQAGMQVNYVAGGGHTHPVTITAANFTTLQQVGQVVVASGLDANMTHSHMVTIMCT